MFNYIFNALKVKIALAKALRNMRNHDHTIEVTNLDDVRGTPGKKMEAVEGYVLESGKFSQGVVVNSDKITELLFMSMMSLGKVKVRKVSASFYTGVGHCYTGKPDGWVATDI